MGHLTKNAIKFTIQRQRELMRQTFINVSTYNANEPCFYDLCERVYKPHNCLFVTLSFRREAHTSVMSELWEKFVLRAAKIACLKQTQAAAQGFALTAPSPHIHCVIYSVKDRRTGATISRLNKAQRDALEQYWLYEASSLTESVDVQSVWEPGGIAKYIAGSRNSRRTMQNMLQLPTINSNLLSNKLNKKLEN